MTRFEIALTTQLRFVKSRAAWAPPAIEFGKPETVGITFRDRLFVWHEIDSEHDPTLTIVHSGDDPSVAIDAQRLLSALAYWQDTGIAAEHFGGSSITDPYGRAIVRNRKSAYASMLADAPETVEVSDDSDAQLVLALYREAINARSPFYKFLALWNGLDVSTETPTERNKFLRARAPAEWRIQWPNEPLPRDVVGYFRESSRNAVAHAVRDDPSKPVIDPDLPQDQIRLLRDASVFRRLVPVAVERRWGQVVKITRASERRV